MTDYRLSNLSKIVKRVNTLANKQVILKDKLSEVEKEAKTKIQEVEDILKYHGIQGSYTRLEHFTVKGKTDEGVSK